MFFLLDVRDRLRRCFFVFGLAFPFEFDMMEGELGKLTYAILYTCCADKVFGFWGLKDEPHALYIVFGIAPIA